MASSQLPDLSEPPFPREQSEGNRIYNAMFFSTTWLTHIAEKRVGNIAEVNVSVLLKGDMKSA